MRAGSQHPIVGPYGIYRGPEGWIAILVLDRQWPAFIEAIGRPELRGDPRFETGALRGQNRAPLTEIVEEWMKAMPSDAAVLDTFERHRVPASPVLSVADTMTHPHFAAREMVRRVPDPLAGEVTIPGFPLKFSELPELPSLVAPLLGEHNREILAEYLGLDDARIRALAETGVLHSERR
jgi:CoA:oxalate CoA-transferase